MSAARPAPHRVSWGRFRCHNDEIAAAEGGAIFSDCSWCFAIMAQGKQVVEAPDVYE